MRSKDKATWSTFVSAGRSPRQQMTKTGQQEELGTLKSPKEILGYCFEEVMVWRGGNLPLVATSQD